MNIQPLPGKCVVKMESLYDAETGPIALPDSMKAKPVYVGTITQANLRGLDKAHIGVDSLEGLRCLFEPRYGSEFEPGRFVFPALIELTDMRGKKYDPPRYKTPILAIVAPDVKLSADGVETAGEAPRCKFCGPADSRNSQQNVIMQPHSTHGWYCPRCHKNRAGDVINPNDYATQVHSPELLRENQVRPKIWA